jgi:hypothetical protein
MYMMDSGGERGDRDGCMCDSMNNKSYAHEVFLIIQSEIFSLNFDDHPAGVPLSPSVSPPA